MKTPDEASALAEVCVGLARGEARDCRAAVTDMSQPLGDAIGNALDVREAIEVLRGERASRLTELTLELVAAALVAVTTTRDQEARSLVEGALASGDALETFRRMVEAQGGDPRVADDPDAVLPQAPVVRPITSPREGVLAAIDAEAIGRASVGLGAGRVRKGDPIDPAVGIVFRTKIGERVPAGERLGEVHARDQGAATTAAEQVLAALTLADEAVDPPPLIYGWHDAA
jgi:thymidine phosphorylase